MIMDDLLREKIESATGGKIPKPGLGLKSINVDNLGAYVGQQTTSNWQWSIYDGTKFPGGYGPTQLQTVDYWTLRARSIHLFTQNMYARGLIRRLITNEINKGLTPESIPDESVLGLEPGSLGDWTEENENRFFLWGKNPILCDYRQRSTFGAIQRAARQEALIAGDILVVLRQSQATRLPTIQLISGNRIQTPLFDNTNRIPQSHTVRHGVQFDSRDRIVGYWIRQDTGEFIKIPAWGEKSGRRIAWLVYGTDKRLDEVRGQPLLSIILQSLKDIDDYRDSAQRKALINSFFAMSVEKDSDKPGTLPIRGGAVRNDEINTGDANNITRPLNVSQYIPGVAVDELQTGEKLKFHGGDGTDTNFAAFEETITAAIAWANELPPEILRLAFSNNYSASQAALNEFRIYQDKIWSSWGEEFCTPIYVEWLIAESLIGKNANAMDILQSWRDNSRFDLFAAWTSVEWYGSIKPTTDMLKQTKGSENLLKMGLSTHAREARITTGTKYSQNIKRLKRENEQLVEAMKPILEAKQQFGEDTVNDVMGQTSSAQDLHIIGEAE